MVSYDTQWLSVFLRSPVEASLPLVEPSPSTAGVSVEPSPPTAGVNIVVRFLQEFSTKMREGIKLAVASPEASGSLWSCLAALAVASLRLASVLAESTAPPRSAVAVTRPAARSRLYPPKPARL